MLGQAAKILACVALLCSASLGCRLREPVPAFREDFAQLEHMAATTEYPDAQTPELNRYSVSHRPHMISGGEPTEYSDLSLQQAIQIALANSKVLRDLGSTVLQLPSLTTTIHGPSIVATDPRFGVEAALSAFDADFSMTGVIDKHDRAFNNRISGLGENLLKQDLAVFKTEVSKRSAAGTQFALRNNIDYANDNIRTLLDDPVGPKLFSSYWNTNFEAEFRQPLGRGRGTEFNRIAGPNGVPGQMNGVVLARIDTDVSLATLELALRNLVSNVENAYWDLYFAYRDLEVKREARDRALMAWRSISAQEDHPGEAQAREQYYRFKQEAQDSLAGRLVDGTRTFNGSPAGTFRGTGGVYVAERRLRLLIGLPVNDGRLIRPSQDPVVARVLFDWDEVVAEAMTRRVELRRQRAQTRRRELELVAARNFLLPQFDFFALYRFRGFGRDLIDPNRKGRPIRDKAGKIVVNRAFDSAFADLTTGDFQEWQMGFELTFPIGFREAHAGLRNAQLQLARERAILEEQERQVLHDLSNALCDLDRAFEVLQTAMNRRIAAEEQVNLLETQRYEIGIDVDLNLILDAQRRKADADARYFGTLVDYVQALKNVHFEKGTLMDYNNVVLAEGPWPGSDLDDDQFQPSAASDGNLTDYTLDPQPTLAPQPNDSTSTILPSPAEY